MTTTTSIRQELTRCLLTDAEIADPTLAIKTIYDGETIAEIRDQFDLMREALFTESYGDLDQNDKWFVSQLVNRTEKLLEAGYIIYKDKQQQITDRNKEEAEIEKALNNNTYSDLDKVVAIIKAVSDPELILTIRTIPDAHSPQSSKYDFLVLLDSMHEPHYAMKRIHAACGHLGNITITFRHSNEISTAISDGSLLYTIICSPENIAYQKKKGFLPYDSTISIRVFSDTIHLLFASEFKKAQHFLTCANQFKTNDEDFGLCLFMLHQAIEMAIRSLFIGTADHLIFGHDLMGQIPFALQFAPELGNILSDGTPQDRELLSLLNVAYSDGRYNCQFKPTPEQVNLLLEKVTQFLATVEQTFEERLQFYSKKS